MESVWLTVGAALTVPPLCVGIVMIYVTARCGWKMIKDRLNIKKLEELWS